MTVELTDEREPSKVLPDEDRPIEEDEVPKKVGQNSGHDIEPAQDGFLTKEMLVAQLRQLLERARASGLNPIRMMAKAYARQGAAILEGLLDALENQDITKKKK